MWSECGIRPKEGIYCNSKALKMIDLRGGRGRRRNSRVKEYKKDAKGGGRGVDICSEKSKRVRS